MAKCKNSERRLDEEYTGKVEAGEHLKADSLLLLNAFCLVTSFSFWVFFQISGNKKAVSWVVYNSKFSVLDP